MAQATGAEGTGKVDAPVPRVVAPASVKPGEIFTLKAIISHRMETGLRKDGLGQVIPRKIINRFACAYGGVEIFSIDLYEAMSANPFIEFSLVATESGLLEFRWEEDGGQVYRLSHELSVG